MVHKITFVGPNLEDMPANLSGFDQNSVKLKSNNIFGLPFNQDDASLLILPVPWEVTVSWRNGASRAPENIYDASVEVDLFDVDYKDAWQKGFYMLPVDKNIRKKSDYLRQCAELIVSYIVEGGSVENNEQLAGKLQEVNNGGLLLYDWVYEMTLNMLNQGKKVGILGGDQSVALGFIKALSEKHENFGILHIDAHPDMRNAYEGFVYSHYSVMYNVLEKVPAVSKIVQLGVRDYSDEEVQYLDTVKDRVITFYDQEVKERQYEGVCWKDICLEIVDQLPDKIYLSFDVDGLDPKLCPNTGSPVPGGLEMEQVMYLLKMLKNRGKEFIGFDLSEISCGEYGGNGIDSIVGARALYKLCNFMMG